MPKVTPGPGQVVEETTRTRVLDGPSLDAEKLPTDSLEYMDSLSADKWQSGNHLVYLYRVDPPVFRNGTGPTYVTKYGTPITLEQIQQDFGGGIWRILVKRGNERMADRNYQIGGTPRDLTRAQQEFNPALPGGVPLDGSNNGVMSQALNLAANPSAQAAQTRMLETAATSAIDMVKASAPAQLTVKDIIELAEKMRGPASQEKPFLETEVGRIVVAAASALVTALVNRVVSPTDPLEQFVKMSEVMSKLSGGNSSSDWKAALVNAAPQIAEAGRGMLQEIRMGAEAQMRINAGRTLPVAPAPQQTGQVSGGLQVQPTPANPAAPQNVLEMPAPPAQTGQVPMEPFETKLIELLLDTQMTGDKAGEILEATWPGIVDEVAQYSVDQIMGAFKSRTILAPHAANPRLRQFLTEFLQWANETDAPAPATPKPSA